MSDGETMPRLVGILAAALLISGLSSPAQARGGGGSHSSHQTTNSSAGLLRGNSGNDSKGGRYLASPAKKLPGKRKPPTLTLKRGKHD